MSEFELLQAFRESRSEDAFAQLVRRYTNLVFSVAKRRLGNAAQAEDITQIVFIRFAKTLPKVQGHAELVAWLHRTTINVTIDTWRSENRRRTREQQAIVMEPVTSENALWEDISPNLDEALNQLKDKDRQALLLRFFGGKTMRDVGVAMGVSEDAAKMRVSRAVDRLRTQLGVGSAACTAAVLATILTERSVEAAPGHLVSRLANMKLPTGAGVSAMGALFDAFLQISKFNLAAGLVVLAVIGISTVQLIRTLNAPASQAVMVNSHTNQTSNATRNATQNVNRRSFNAGNFNASVVATRPVKMIFNVVDAETGVGLANTKIHVAFFGAGGMGESHDMETDNNGAAAIPEPDDATKTHGMNVFVVAEGHVPKAVNSPDKGNTTDYTMKLDLAMTAGGLVVDEQGLPMAGVKIFIQGPGNVPGQAENVDFQTCPVTSHDDGSWSCSYLPKDYTNEIRFILKNSGYAVTFPVVPVAQVDLTNLILVIDRGFIVTGQITDSQNRPIADTRINTLDGDRNKRLSTKTDANGIYTLVGVPGEVGTNDFYQEPVVATNDSGGAIIRGLSGSGPLHVELAVQADGFMPKTSTVELSDATNIANLVLSPGNIFRGRMVDEGGNPISNAVVQTDWDNQGIRTFEWGTRTDADGRFEWNSAPQKPLLFWFEADGYQVQRDVLQVADGSEHEIILKRNTAK